MSEDELAVVREGVKAYESLRADLAQALPFWPLGLPTSRDDVVVLGLRAPAATYLYLWFPRAGEQREIALPLPTAVAGATVETVYPRSLPAYELDWDTVEHVLRVTPTVSGPTARVLRIA
jgi:alpha-galactosidase